MKRVPALLWLCVLVVIALGSIGCGSSHTRVRFVDASPDETSLSLLVDGKVVAEEELQKLMQDAHA